MDLVLDFADLHLLDKTYTGLHTLLPQPYQALVEPILLDRTHFLRQSLSLFLITFTYGFLFYFSFATLSYFVTFDKSLLRHPKFLKHQIRQEILLSLQAFAPISLMTVPWFLLEVRGHSRLYSEVQEHGWPYLALSIVLFLLFTDMCIYWIHRWLHHPLLYARIHKPHHKWIVPTPFASHAFHPLDGYLQSIAYHMFVFLFPMQKFVYLFMFAFVNCWTISIHDGEYFTQSALINGAANHTIHHLYFNYNYGQYFTLWDRLGGTYRQPTQRQYDRQIKESQANRLKEAAEVETIFIKDKFMKDTTVEYIYDDVIKSKKVQMTKGEEAGNGKED